MVYIVIVSLLSFGIFHVSFTRSRSTTSLDTDAMSTGPGTSVEDKKINKNNEKSQCNENN